MFIIGADPAWVVARFEDQAANGQPGVLTAILSTGEVISCQPDGRLETRPGGTYGPWERLNRVRTTRGEVVVFHTLAQGYAFPLAEILT